MDRQPHDYSVMAFAQQQQQAANIQQQQQQFGFHPQHQQFPPSVHGPPFMPPHPSMQPCPFHHMQQAQQNQEETKDEVKLSSEKRKNKRKKRILQQVEKADKRGVCYLSHIPPKMDHIKLRQLLSQYGDTQRIYLTPEKADFQSERKMAGGFRGQKFSEGWVEFTNKRVAKDVAETLNGEQMGGRKRSPFYHYTWNIKFLSKFKWDDLTEEIAYKSATREQKLALNMSAAKRERDFYLSKVDQSHAQKHIAERLQKKQKVNPEQEEEPQVPYNQVMRQYPQTRPLADKPGEKKQLLSKDVLAGVFGLGAS